MPRTVALILAFVIGISSVGEAQTPANLSSRGTVAWTIGGAGGGFGIGLWVGLTKFDDSTNSDRKVWTTAIVGAAVGAVAGYFFGRPRRASRPSPSPSKTAPMLPEPVVWPRNIGASRNIVASHHGVS